MYQSARRQGTRVLSIYHGGYIYQAATRALLWLGEDDGTFDVAGQLMISLVRQMKDLHGGPQGADVWKIWDVLKKFEWGLTSQRSVSKKDSPQSTILTDSDNDDVPEE